MDTPTAQTQKTEEKVLPESERNEKPNRLDEKAKEVQKLQAMMGSNKQQEAKFVLNEENQTKVLGEDSHSGQATIYIKGCKDSTYTIDSLCTKVLVESCTNVKVTLNKKIITNMVDVYKCENVDLIINTDVGTLQADVCKKLNVQIQSKNLFKTLVWQAVHDLSLSFDDAPEHKLLTGFNEMKSQYPNIVEDIDQFITRFHKDKLLTEQIVRLKNGYPTTEREAAEFDRKQEEAIQKLAAEAGITISKKKPTGPKVKPNDPCTCGSGKKYKKCHGSQAS